MAERIWWVKFEPKAWLADTSSLTNAQEGVYIRLISLYYAKRQPLRPDRMASIARVTQDEWDRDYWPALSDYFSLGEDGFYHHAKCDEALAEAVELSEKRRQAAALAHEAREENKRRIADLEAKLASASQTDEQARTQLQVQIQLEEEKKEQSRPSPDAASPKPVQASLLPEPDKPPPTSGQILWTEGLDIYCRLTKSTPEKIRPAFRKLAEIAGPEAMMEVLRDCDKDPPRNAYSWIRNACEARAKSAKVRLVIDNDPLDFYGIQKFLKESVPGIKPTEHPKDQANGKWLWGSYVIDHSLRSVMEATGLPTSWRGDLSIVMSWIESGLHPSRDIAPVIKRVVNSGRFDSTKPLAYFNPMLTEKAA